MQAFVFRWNLASSGRSIVDYWPLVLGVLALAVPTTIALAQEHWSTEAGAHGPLVLVTGGWLIWRQLRGFVERRRGALAISLALLVPSLIFYTFGRAYDFLSLEAAGIYGAGIALVYSECGPRFVQRLWFPLLYLAFAIPLPGWLIDFVTAPLKEFASVFTTGLLQLAGVPIVREGVTLYVAQYQLLVEDACAGMNSIMGLLSLGLFYTYILHGSSWRYCALLVAFILPIAVLANVVRIIILVLLTLWGGNDAAQSFLHEGAGLVMFATALLLVFTVDTALSRLISSRKTQA